MMMLCEYVTTVCLLLCIISLSLASLELKMLDIDIGHNAYTNLHIGHFESEVVDLKYTVVNDRGTGIDSF